MVEVFKQYLAEKMPLTEADWAVIEPVCIIKKLKKHQFLLQEGDVWRYHAFVCKGVLRRYSIDAKGVEHIIQFSIENWWAGDRDSLMNKTPSKYNIDAVEDSIILVIRNEDFDRLYQQLPAFNNMVNQILFRSFNASQERINATISMTAEEKYLYFINTFPALANRIPRHMVASYLGITPETLSRVKSNLSKNK
ncbi:cyclic nucleotide-binding protein [Niastella koreensis]|uniref:Cyclic nucleotide-binding protein n=2 Tax=Niastella koreensis TaxID=354356 RepID=A0ABX3NUG9_9BACT|nr:Crp/Fnr family transcriptional regulator [Niastella koreensis]AEW02183.1 putative transcriptional regulator, Crp/Fnr family [Niastella koreensis GR20-10]OQP45059.1 cyclic nucleotide-binding protein [Niastella koreensis]